MGIRRRKSVIRSTPEDYAAGNSPLLWTKRSMEIKQKLSLRSAKEW